MTSDPESPSYLTGRLHQALAEDPRVNDPTLHVWVAENKVLVTGTVTTPERRQAVLEVVGENAPGYVIEDQIRLAELSEAPEEEELE